MLQRSLSLIISRQTMSFQSQSCSVSFWQYILLVPFLAISIFSQSLVTCMSAFMSSSFIADWLCANNQPVGWLQDMHSRAKTGRLMMMMMVTMTQQSNKATCCSLIGVLKLNWCRWLKLLKMLTQNLLLLLVIKVGADSLVTSLFGDPIVLFVAA